MGPKGKGRGRGKNIQKDIPQMEPPISMSTPYESTEGSPRPKAEEGIETAYRSKDMKLILDDLTESDSEEAAHSHKVQEDEDMIEKSSSEGGGGRVEESPDDEPQIKLPSPRPKQGAKKSDSSEDKGKGGKSKQPTKLEEKPDIKQTSGEEIQAKGPSKSKAAVKSHPTRKPEPIAKPITQSDSENSDLDKDPSKSESESEKEVLKTKNNRGMKATRSQPTRKPEPIAKPIPPADSENSDLDQDPFKSESESEKGVLKTKRTRGRKANPPQNQLPDSDEDSDSIDDIDAKRPQPAKTTSKKTTKNTAAATTSRQKKEEPEEQKQTDSTDARKTQKSIHELVMEALEMYDERKGVSVPTIKKHIIDNDDYCRQWSKLMPMVKKAMEKLVEQEKIFKPKSSEHLTGLTGRFKINRTVVMKAKKPAPKKKITVKSTDATFTIPKKATQKKQPQQVSGDQTFVVKPPKKGTTEVVSAKAKGRRRRSKSSDLSSNELKRLQKTKTTGGKRSKSVDAPDSKAKTKKKNPKAS